MDVKDYFTGIKKIEYNPNAPKKKMFSFLEIMMQRKLLWEKLWKIG